MALYTLCAVVFLLPVVEDMPIQKRGGLQAMPTAVY